MYLPKRDAIAKEIGLFSSNQGIISLYGFFAGLFSPEECVRGQETHSILLLFEFF